MKLTEKEAQAKLGNLLQPRYKQYGSDRKTLETQWMKDLRQYRGVYDPEILALIPADKSHVYPKETHTKVVGFVAKIMEMMFPASDKNWSVTPTPIPSIPEDILNEVISNMMQQRIQEAQAQDAAAQQQAQPGQPPAPPTQPVPLSSKDIEAAIKIAAYERSQRMEKTIEDMLLDLGGDTIDFPQLSKKVLRSGGIYGYGILKGPQVQYKEERWFEQDPQTGQYKAVVTKKPRALFEWVKVWDFFPDLTAKGWRKQDGVFERMIVNRHTLKLLKEKDDFLADGIAQALATHPKGNYTYTTFDKEIDDLNNISNVQAKERNKFEVVRWLGYLNGGDLLDAGVEGIKDTERDADMLADVWMIENIVIKADLAPFGENPADSYHAFIFEEDEDSGLTGRGLPVVLRDSQMRLCAIDRASQDNMAASAGPVYEVNRDLLPPGQTNIGVIHAFKTIYREGTGPDASAPAVRSLATDSHITELISLRREVLETFDRESSLPGWLFGQTQQLGEAFRTSNNMSQMTGGANMVTKDIVRAFDIFTQSVIGSVVKFVTVFKEYYPDAVGDYNVVTKGNISLVAKEVRGAALDQFWMSLQPDERLRFKDFDVLVDRLKSRDLPTDLLEEKEVGDKKVADWQAAQAAVQTAEAKLTEAKAMNQQATATKSEAAANAQSTKLKAEVAEILSRVDQNLSTVQDTAARHELEKIRVMLDALKGDMEHQVYASETAAKIISMGKKNEQGQGSGNTSGAAS